MHDLSSVLRTTRVSGGYPVPGQHVLKPICSATTLWGIKKHTKILFCITSRNINRFSKFFHCLTQEDICYKSVITYPTTP